MQKRHKDRRQYFQELAATTEKYILPFIGEIYNITSDTHILEVGCGEGGNLKPFVERGCHVMGVDMDPTRIEQAKKFFNEDFPEYEIELVASDIFKVSGKEEYFDFLFIHDVIEHIPEKEQFIKHLKDFIAPGGYLFVAFPAWQMPFGGHQQICRNTIPSHIPFIHILPRNIYRFLLKMMGEKEDTISELLSIKDSRVSIEQFKKLIARSDYQIIRERLYFINPHYETKFGLKPRKLWSFIGSIPYIRNYFCTSCFYLLRRIN